MSISLKGHLPPNKPRRLLPTIWAKRRAPLLSSSSRTICSSGTWCFILGLPLRPMKLAGPLIAPITAKGMPRKPLWHYSNMALKRCTCIGSSLPVNLRTLLRGGLWKSWVCDERPTLESASGVRTIGGGTNTSMLFWKKSGSLGEGKGLLPRHLPYSPKCLEGVFSEVRLEKSDSRKLAAAHHGQRESSLAMTKPSVSISLKPRRTRRLNYFGSSC